MGATSVSTAMTNFKCRPFLHSYKIMMEAAGSSKTSLYGILHITNQKTDSMTLSAVRASNAVSNWFYRNDKLCYHYRKYSGGERRSK
jgi:hypothetical protein